MEKISIYELLKVFKEECMDINNMRNIVILKNLPSNLVDEAFVVLKKNQRIKKLEYVENKSDNFSEDKNKTNQDEYVVREAELVISNYINTLENQDFKGLKMNSDLAKKYIRLRRFSYVLGIILLISLCYIMFF